MNTPAKSKNKQLQAAIYTNVSAMMRLRGDDTFNKLHEVQTALCQTTADELGLKVIDEYHDEHDGDHSLNALVSLVGHLHTDRNIDVVLVPQMDAFGRKTLQRDEILEVIRGCGAKVVAAGSRALSP
jgi:DNA invertase Pin-like site-specific DNA recombinase